MIASPIFILGAHKSGTSLIRSLLDGHPEIFAVPIESHFFPLMKRWVDYPFQRTAPERIAREDFIGNATAWLARSNQSRWRYADNAAVDMFDIQVFRQDLEKSLSGCGDPDESPQAYFDAYMRAIHIALHGKELEADIRVAEKSVENAEFAPELAQWYPEARFIHVVRNPYAVITAYRKSRGTEQYPWLGKIYTALNNTLYHLDRNRRVLKHYNVIRYEDLVSHPRRVIESLAEALKLPFTAGLLQPTLLAEPWEGNSSSGRRFEGISGARRDRWREEISALEAAVVNRYLSHLSVELGYPQFEHPGTVYRPATGERPKEYFANRLLLKTGWRP